MNITSSDSRLTIKQIITDRWSSTIFTLYIELTKIASHKRMSLIHIVLLYYYKTNVVIFVQTAIVLDKLYYMYMLLIFVLNFILFLFYV